MNKPATYLYNAPRYLLIGLIRVYQVVLSPVMGNACRFTPTCSNYGIEALKKYGAVKGSILTIYRILRCNPWGGSGYDPPRWFGEAPPPDPADQEHHHHS